MLELDPASVNGMNSLFCVAVMRESCVFIFCRYLFQNLKTFDTSLPCDILCAVGDPVLGRVLVKPYDRYGFYGFRPYS